MTAFGIQGSGQLVGGAPDPGVFREVAVRAEELGYDSIWAGDHISYRNPILDIVVALSTFAAVTSRITLGAGIVLLPLRHPSVVAKEFASLDYVSGGRTILGVGVGGESGPDFDAVGVLASRARRAHRRLDAGAARALPRAGRPAYAGAVLLVRGNLDRAAAGAGRRAAALGRRPLGGRRSGERATLGDGWIPIWVSARGDRRGRRAAAGARDARRHPARARRRPAARSTSTCASATRATSASTWSTATASPATPEQCVARVREYVDAGAQHVVFNILELDDAERLMEVARAAAG